MENTKSDGKEEEESVVLEIPLGDAAETFNLEKAACSHGLFMMSPNHWDPLSRTFSRPLRLSLSDSDPQVSTPTTSLFVSISHLPRSLSVRHQEALVAQVVRMLRLSETDERNAREFRKMAEAAATEENCSWLADFGGRVFRSPTLFEDMVKCILLCNCQWPRTLSMARALCELQFDLQCKSSGVFGSQAANATVKNECNDTAHNFIPNTPAGKESKRNIRASKVSKKLASKFVETKTLLEADAKLKTDSAHTGREISIPSLSLERVEDDSCERCSSRHGSDSGAPDSLQSQNGIQPGVNKLIGNFPSPRELANLDESFLAKRCNLGYRAIRIIKLAQSVVEGRIPLREVEESCANGANSSLYNKLADQFRKIDGFGPFTCANVLMCMGFYHIIPTDSETVRHLKKVHARKSTIQTVHRDVEVIYGKYAPFQFLAYWAELWHFYEKRFGKLSEMPPSDYKLITASNMRSKGGRKNKKTKRC
ncbi:DNA-3-methyladenine glycosylase [Salix suchowensis]|nr:DNA-3-methyladenine glycosylase [Salix suchowensis]